MISFDMLSPTARAMFALLALLLCLVNICNIILAAEKKRYLLSGIALCFFAPVYLIWQIVFDLALAEKYGTSANVLCDIIGKTGWGLWLAAFAVLTIATALAFGYNISYEKNYVTPGSVKLFLDKMPCGICCWHDNGRVLFSNVCMNDLCVALTDERLLNGNHFSSSVADRVIDVDGRRWRFSCRDIVSGAERLHEMIAYDITAEYAKTQMLERDKAELSRLNDELKEYTAGIDEAVRHREILQARVNIHDEMNRLMLSTMAMENDDSAKLDRIFALWEQNALLLCMQSDENADKKTLSHIEELAEALKISLIWQNDLSASLSEKQRALMYSAIREAIVNAAKHARATNMDVSFVESETEIRCLVKNDGKMPDEEVVFSGGLKNLQRLACKQNVRIEVCADNAFTLSLIFRK